MSVARPIRIVGTADLKVLHTLKESEQMGRMGIAVQPRFLQGREQFVSRLKRRKKAFLWLLFDDPATQ